MLDQTEIDRMLEDAPVPDVLGERNGLRHGNQQAGETEDGEIQESLKPKSLRVSKGK